MAKETNIDTETPSFVHSIIPQKKKSQIENHSTTVYTQRS